MKRRIRAMMAVLLCLSSLLGLIACASEEAPAETTENDVVTTEQETTKEEITEMEEIKEKVSLDGKRVIFIGNSYVYHGRTVMNVSSSVMTQAERENDRGIFYQLCKANGMEVNVTNWTFGGHGLADFFGAPCAHASSACRGTRHENELKNRYYDYVFVSPGGGDRQASTIADDFDNIIKFFKDANPDVKIVCLANLGCHGYSSFGTDLPAIYNYYSTLADKGVIIADWGGLVYRIMHGIYSVPGGSQSYGKYTFIVKDGYHPNMLSGYIASLMAYCTVTGESAVGQPYDFCSNASLNSWFDFEAYVNSTFCSKFIQFELEEDVFGVGTIPFQQGGVRLTGVVEDSVNKVGVDVNTATPSLLSYVSGINNTIAKNIVKYRDENGKLKERKELLKVSKLGKVAFEQCAGFLRIPGANNPLDNTAVHPERYTVVESIAKDMNCSVEDLIKDKEIRSKIDIKKYVTKEVGIPTLTDIMAELEKPGRDPRQAIKVFEFDKSVKSIDDLKEGMKLPGIITNITNFGCFVDVGIKENGLVHVSQLCREFVSDPTNVVNIHQHVEVKVIGIDKERKRVSLTMILD